MVGGLLGNQVGGGSGKALATMAGVVGGAMAGNALEETPNVLKGYEAIVRHGDGSTSRLRISTAHTWRVGDAVDVRGGQVVAPLAATPRRLPY